MTEIKSVPLNAQRILVMRYRFIGDTILTVPFLRNLRRAYPHAVIDVLVGPNSGEVLQGCPYINNLITYDTTRFHKYDQGSNAKPKNLIHYAFELRRNKYDMVLLLKRSLSAGILAFLSGARYRVGYDTEGRGLLLTHRVKWRGDVHEVESTLDVLRAAGVAITDDYLEAWATDAELKKVNELAPELATADGAKRILFHAASAHPDKLYPLEHWATLLKTLTQKHRILPCFIGDKQDLPIYEELEKLSGVRGLNLAGKLSLRESMAFLQNLDLAICTDSGPAHLAAAANVPVIALFGPTDPQRWRPWGDKHVALFDESLPCRPCNYVKVCDDLRPCLSELSPARVAAEAERILQLNQRTGATK